MTQYGVSATYLLKQRLLAEIKNELLFTSKAISEIAYAFSFAEPSHLMRFFKQQTGKTCREFQEDYKNGVYEWELDIMTQIEILKKNIQEAETIIVGGASGMSAAAGFRFYYMSDATFKQ